MGDVRKNVKRPFRNVEFEPFDFTQQAEDQVPPLVEGIDHIANPVHWRFQGCYGSPLANCIGPTGDLPLKFCTCLCDPGGSPDIPDPPTGHGESFRNSIYGDRPVIHPRDSGHARMSTSEVDVLVYLVRDHQYMRVLFKYVRQSFKFLPAVDRSARVAGGAVPDHFCFRGDGSPQLVRGNLEV